MARNAIRPAVHEPGFGNWFRVRCDQAGLPHCTAHGLRKAGATIAAERGASERQLMAIFGWQTSKQAVLYTRAAEAEGARRRRDDAPFHRAEVSVRAVKAEHARRTKVSHFYDGSRRWDNFSV